MHKPVFTFLLFLLSTCLFSQVNVEDSLKRVFNAEIVDSLKIDQLNQYIFKYAPNHPDLVLGYADSTIALSEQLQDSLRIANSYNRKGIALYYLGDFNGALDQYFMALSIREKLKHREEIWREYNNIGLVLRNLDQNEEALRYFELTLKHSIELGDKAMEAIVLNNMGMSYRGMKQFDQAKQMLESALAINQEINERQSIVRNLINLGNLHYDLKNYTLALEYIQQASQINRELQNKYEEAQIYNNLARLNLALENLPEVKVNLLMADKILIEIGAQQLRMNNLSIFADYYTIMGEFEQALFYQKKYSLLRDSIFYASRKTQFDQLKTIANAEKEIERLGFLERINAIQNEKLQFQRTLQWGALGVIFIISVLLFVVLRNLRIKKQLNQSLSIRSQEVETLNKELKSYNEELYVQRENLNKTLISLQNTQKQLIQSEKMASLGLLAAGVAHEINNPLHFIMGGYIGLEEYFSESETVTDERVPIWLDSIKTGVHRAGDIVKALGQFSRGNEDLDEDCNIHQILDNCLVMIRNQCTDHIEIKKNYYDKPVFVTGNVGKLHQVFVNILTNSIHAIESDGRIGIGTSVVDRVVIIEISDSGCGISKEDMPRITDPFFTTKEPGKGTGLGLSIAYKLIDEHKGSLEFFSEPAEGTTVRIRIPQSLKL